MLCCLFVFFKAQTQTFFLPHFTFSTLFFFLPFWPLFLSSAKKKKQKTFFVILNAGKWLNSYSDL